MNIIAKKSLGQNFLKSQSAIRDIISASDICEGDIVLEVGPGKGILTEKLLEKAKKVYAVEKDDRMISFLQEKFQKEIDSQKLILVHADILEFNILNFSDLEGNYKLIANIPYYITGQFLRKFLSSSKKTHHQACNQPVKMVLMLQKEVAKRIVASDKKESILSISVKAYGVAKYIKTVPAEYFSPKPKVDSAILLISDISKKFFDTITEENFFAIVKKGFSHKRKILMQNLEIAKEKRQEIIEKTGIPEKARAEDISLEQWKCLVESKIYS
jgi:16S rRNA (adenine1518-N6/adenine1519-N6)-dimethyltransferase